MKIYILGYKGMLGRYVYTYLKSKGHPVVGIGRDELDVANFTESQLQAALFHKKLKKGDVIINCVGTIKPQIDKLGVPNAIKVNSLFPHYLANVSKKEGYKMIHITTDCVFSGNDGQYREDSLHDCLDVYGKTKSLGEPENCTVIRTSIIGEEVNSKRSLVEWVKSINPDDPSKPRGFTNHYWNGITCLQAAKIFEQIISENKYWDGVKHVFSPTPYTKCALVSSISNAYGLNIEFNPVEAPSKCDRTLKSIFEPTFTIPELRDQIIQMRDYHDTLFSKI